MIVLKQRLSFWDIPCSFVGIIGAGNEKSAERAEMVSEGYRKFISHTCSLKKIQQLDDKNKSFQYLRSIDPLLTHVPLLPARLKFFEMVSGKPNAFLGGFQTNKPMVPFVADILGDLVRNFFGRTILKDVLKKKSSLYNLIQIDPLDKNTRKKSRKCR